MKDNCKPRYPARSKLQQETGTVALSFWVSAAGQVIDSKIVRSTGFYDLDQVTWVNVTDGFKLDECPRIVRAWGKQCKCAPRWRRIVSVRRG